MPKGDIMGELKPLVDRGVNLVDMLVGDEYRMCFAIAEKLYEDEQARQACCATLMIQYSNLRKTNVKLKEAIDAMNAIAKSEASTERHASDTGEFLRLYFAPLAKAYPKAGDYLEHMVATDGYSDVSDAIERMQDYMRRNGFDYEMECRLSVLK